MNKPVTGSMPMQDRTIEAQEVAEEPVVQKTVAGKGLGETRADALMP